MSQQRSGLIFQSHIAAIIQEQGSAFCAARTVIAKAILRNTETMVSLFKCDLGAMVERTLFHGRRKLREV